MRKSIDHRGCRLAYEVQGQGPPVLLIQGVGVHGNGWRPQVEALADRYTCLSFDNRGMGESQSAGAPVTVGQMAEDAVALLDAEGWDSAPPTPRMIWIGLRTRVGTRRMRRRAFLQLVMSPGTAEANPGELAERLAPLFGHDLADQPPIVSRQLAAMRAYNASSMPC